MFKTAQSRSLIRSLLKVVGSSAAVYFGVTDADAATVVDALGVIGGAAMTIYGVYLSWKDKRPQA